MELAAPRMTAARTPSRSKLPIAVTTLSERFRRTVIEDNLALAQRIYEKAQGTQRDEEGPLHLRMASGLLQQPTGRHSLKEERRTLPPAKRAEWAQFKASQRPFDIRNEIDDSRESSVMSARRNHHHHHHSHHQSQYQHQGRSSASSSSSSSSPQLPNNSSQAWESGLGLPTPLTARIRERERQRASGKAKSSLALALEHDASIEMVKWLIEMGHERSDFSRDSKNYTIVSLAAQKNRCDVIEACCIDAVANAAALHHARSTVFQSKPRFGDIDLDDTLEEDEESKDKSFPLARDEQVQKINGNLAQQVKKHPERPAEGTPLPGDLDIGSSSSSEVGENIVQSDLKELLNWPDDLGRTALSLAAMKGFEDVVTLLLDLGADIDQADKDGNSPLHYASAHNHLLVVKLLIERGCRFAAKNDHGFTASDYAYTLSLKAALEAFGRTQYEGRRNARRKATNNGGSAVVPAAEPHGTTPVRGIRSLTGSPSQSALGLSSGHGTPTRGPISLPKNANEDEHQLRSFDNALLDYAARAPTVSPKTGPGSSPLGPGGGGNGRRSNNSSPHAKGAHLFAPENAVNGLLSPPSGGGSLSLFPAGGSHHHHHHHHHHHPHPHQQHQQQQQHRGSSLGGSSNVVGSVADRMRLRDAAAMSSYRVNKAQLIPSTQTGADSSVSGNESMRQRSVTTESPPTEQTGLSRRGADGASDSTRSPSSGVEPAPSTPFKGTTPH